MKFFVYFVFVLVLINNYCYSIPLESNNSLLDCGHVKQIFESKSISKRPPDIPINGEKLVACQSKLSCCTIDMESHLKALVKKDYQSLLQHHVQSVQGVIASTAIHFQDYVRQMIMKAENKTLKAFLNLFEVVPDTTVNSIKLFYSELEKYLSNKTDLESISQRINAEENFENAFESEKLAQLTSSFFVRLFPFVYQFNISSRFHEFHPEYESCLVNIIQDIKPFGDVVKVLEKDIAKTLEATKILIAALNFGVDVLNQSNVYLMSETGFNSNQCYEALLKMSYCSRCNGLPLSVKPCSGYCLNVMQGCLAYHVAELHPHWNGFYESVEKLISVINSGQSVICLEDLLRGLHSRIAEAVMFFRTQNQSIHNKVKFICGQVRWAHGDSSDGANSKPMAETKEIIPGLTFTSKISDDAFPDWNLEEQDLNFRSTLLSNKVKQFKDSAPKSRGFYLNLANTLCSDETYIETRELAKCWNGQKVGEYTKPVVSIGLSAQKYNPEMTLTPSFTDPRISQLVEKLRRVRQVVLSQVAINPESDSFSQIGNEEGSGNGASPLSNSEQWIDDEDNDSDADWKDQGSGSGEVPPVTIVPDNTDTNVRRLPEDKNPPSNDKTPTKENYGIPVYCSSVLVILTTIVTLFVNGHL